MAIPTISQNIASQGVSAVAKKSLSSEVNYVFRIQELVNRIIGQLSRFSEQSKMQSDALKKDYKFNSMEAARLQEKVGSTSPIFAGFALFASCVHIGLQSFIPEGAPKDDHVILQTLSAQIPKLTEQLPIARDFYISRIQADQMRKQSKSALENTEIANEGQKNGEGSNFQQELLGLLNNVRESFKRVTG